MRYAVQLPVPLESIESVNPSASMLSTSSALYAEVSVWIIATSSRWIIAVWIVVFPSSSYSPHA